MKSVINLLPQAKPIFATPRDARLALACDKLGAVYVKASAVFVITAHGSGTFTFKEWKESAGEPTLP